LFYEIKFNVPCISSILFSNISFLSSPLGQLNCSRWAVTANLHEKTFEMNKMLYRLKLGLVLLWDKIPTKMEVVQSAFIFNCIEITLQKYWSKCFPYVYISVLILHQFDLWLTTLTFSWYFTIEWSQSTGHCLGHFFTCCYHVFQLFPASWLSFPRNVIPPARLVWTAYLYKHVFVFVDPKKQTHFCFIKIF